MRLPRPRFTVWRLMLVVAAIAAGLVLVGEFGEGLPPRYILRGIPARIDRLRRGMTRRQSYAILGLNQSWMTGGIGARPGERERRLNSIHEAHYVRAPRIVIMNHEGGPLRILQSSGMIQLWYCQHPRSASGHLDDESDELVRASFSVDGRTIAEMPGSP